MPESQSISAEMLAGPSPVTSICIGVLTFRRPEILDLTVRSLLAQTLLQDPSVAIDILIVDNDDQESAREIATKLAQTSACPIRYASEPKRGIVHGRNRVLSEFGDADFLALIDDDEVAEPDWLENLYRMQRARNVDIVSGPVFPIFEDAPEWVKEGGFFAPAYHPDGSSPPFLATNNILMRGELARKHRFDERFNMTSGEDTFFFLELERAGARTAWCNSARVSEKIPAARTTVEWLGDRQRSAANRYTRCMLYLEPGPKTALSRLLRVGGNIVSGTLLFLRNPFSIIRRVQSLQQFKRAAGTLAGIRGSSHIYYQQNQSIT